VLNKDALKSVHKRVLGMTFDNTLLVSTDKLIKAHAGLNIRNNHYDRMKYHYLLSMLNLNTPVEMIFKVI